MCVITMKLAPLLSSPFFAVFVKGMAYRLNILLVTSVRRRFGLPLCGLLRVCLLRCSLLGLMFP